MKATGDILLFLHADTLVPPNWSTVVRAALSRNRVAAGAFRFRLEGFFPGKRFVEIATNCRSSWLQLPYGDQALFLPRATFEELGGYSNLPILEDYELVRRLRSKGRIVTVAEEAIASARRWQQKGVLLTTMLNQIVIAGYHLGLAPGKLATLYGRPQNTRPTKPKTQIT